MKKTLITEINRQVGFEPKMEFKEGLKNTVDWFKESWEDIKSSADFGPGMSSAVPEIAQKEEN